MIRSLPRVCLDPLRWLAFASIASLAGCISSAEPMLTDSKPLLGETVYLEVYHLRDGVAQGHNAGMLRWQDGRYVVTEPPDKNTGYLTLHALEGSDLLVQSIEKDNSLTQYAVARKVTDGAYLVFVVDELDADEATRSRYCGGSSSDGCNVTTPEAVFAFARATAAAPHNMADVALLMAAP
jgi:hypothetical protein